MIDAKRLLDQLLGPGGTAETAAAQVRNRLDRAGGTQSFAGGAIAGGLLGMLLGGKGPGKMMRYGGAAALGALALQAYQNYQRQQQPGRAGGMSAFAGMPAPHQTPAADGGSFELVLVRAMVGAAKADGHIDAAEQRRLFAEVERMGLDAEAKAYVFDLLTKDVDVASLARAVTTEEQAAELYLAARLAIDLDEPAERAYLDALASRLQLAPGLRAQLDAAPDASGGR